MWFEVLLLLYLIKTGACIMCSQCDSKSDPRCIDHPPPPRNCTVCVEFDLEFQTCVLVQELSYCIVERRYRNNTLIRLTRDCSPAAMRKTCEYIFVSSRPTRVCYTTCKTNGCNLNSAATIGPPCRTVLLGIVLLYETLIGIT